MKLSRLSAAVAATVALWAFAPVAPLAQVRLPALGESVSDDFSVSAEHKLGEQIMHEVRRDPDYIDDPQLLDYLQTIWQPLVQAARERGEIGADTDTLYGWEPFLVRDRTVNAFALPGGYVGVHLGLMAITVTRDELAAVLAHELSHVTQRHIARSMTNASRQSLVGLAAIILGAIAAGRSGSADATQAVIVGGQAALQQGQLNFSRDMEREADRVGYGVLSTAGFSPGGVASMFEKLEYASRLNDSGAYPYLRSHPLTTERIGEARNRSSVGKAVPQSAPLWHVLMQARARVLMDPRDQSLRRLQGADAVPAAASPAERLSALYASALASTELRDWSRADTALQQALAVVRNSPHGDTRADTELQWLRAQSLVARGEPARALELVSSLPDDGSRTGMLLRAEAATAAHAARVPQAAAPLRKSMETLQTWVSVNRNDASAWTHLAQASDQLGLRLRALRAEAEARAVVGDLNGAIDRLRAGQRLARQATPAEFVDASIVEARLRELQHQRRELMAEMRGERRGGSREEPQE
ncbi:M48 family metalloprotease [Ideonella sp. BN130291]|uniref:M48 family metalloprotease n=1 Tax=Ideonella sp. BN130291 TaxID=3112940 RepID=UPI002E27273D|nr:M48 family metalloprotease [Ideonella sp. BN130291]